MHISREHLLDGVTLSVLSCVTVVKVRERHSVEASLRVQRWLYVVTVTSVISVQAILVILGLPVSCL